MIVWVAVAWAGGDPCADQDAVSARSAAIKQLYDEGEAERDDRSADATSVLERDEQRVKAVKKYDKKHQLCTVEDKWYAAWIMTQADDLPTLERAYALAQDTMNERYQNGPWLVAYTFDLKRVSGGYRQSYGTQTQVNERGQRCLVEIEPDVTDQERAQYSVRPIADEYRLVLDLNGYRDDAPTLASVQRRGLYCPAQPLNPKDAKKIAPPPDDRTSPEPVPIDQPETLDPVR